MLRLIRIGKAQPRQDAGFQRFHLFGFGIDEMVVTEQMQYPMHRHMRPMILHGFALFACFARDDRCTDGYVA